MRRLDCHGGYGRASRAHRIAAVTSNSGRQPAEERLISLHEAAQRSGLSTGFLRRLSRQGAISATKVGRDWITTWAAVAEYLADSEKRSKNPRKGRRG